MPQIIAWQCPKTKKLFADKAAYRKHLDELARQRYRKRTRERFMASAEERIKTTLKRASTFEEIEDWFLDEDNSRFLAERMARLQPEIIRSHKPDFRLKSVAFSQMRWDVLCPNTHVAPDGCPKNWLGEPDLPRGYPGWRGKVTYELAKDSLTFSTDILKDTGIKTGSGGGGGGKYSYSCTLFEADWPSLSVMERLARD